MYIDPRGQYAKRTKFQLKRTLIRNIIGYLSRAGTDSSNIIGYQVQGYIEDISIHVLL